MTRQSFLKGSFILMTAGLITRILGMINGMVLARVIGDEGVGLFMMAFPAMLLVVTLTELGLPVAISKLIAEAQTFGNYRKIKLILVWSLSIVGLVSVVLTTTMLLVIPLSAKYLFADTRVVYPLLAITPVIPIVAVSSVIRGYFQGIRNMKPYAYSGIVEQVVRISLVATLANLLMPYGVAYAAAGAMVAGSAGECASLLYMLYIFKHDEGIKLKGPRRRSLKGTREIFRDLLRIGLPTMGSRLIGSLSNFLEPMIASHALVIAGFSIAESTKLYGQLTGYAMTLLLLPSFITHALHVSLVPAASEAYARKSYKMIHYRLNQALRIAMLTGGLSVIVTYSFAEPLMDIIYDAPEASQFLHIMAPFFLIFYFQAPMHAVLQAVDKAKAAMYNTLIGAIIKNILLFILTCSPEFGIKGTALAICINVVLVTMLHAAVMFHAIGFSLIIRDYIRTLILILFTAFIARLLIQHAFITLALLPRTMALIAVITAFYTVLASFLGLLQKEQLSQLPMIGKWFS
ncbi:stage V sporulation protein B [Sporolactobacillus sp. CPB3-1]|uniref:Stage V sporulation protein B n=1 Tax=Sporolactobacillus mangiferae TaxID=2940498 RepID=A0ABT0M7Y7_9BACL|nr:stage V sporulation protein B [Sporolactobacillus mangiferae]MCL1630490.1 stage V sporulation protein B [Sporolactobacillus mangiferae]